MATPASGAARARASRLRRAARARSLSRSDRAWLDAYERTHATSRPARPARPAPRDAPRATLDPPDDAPVSAGAGDGDAPPVSPSPDLVSVPDIVTDGPPPPVAIASDVGGGYDDPFRASPSEGSDGIPPPPPPSAGASVAHDDLCPYGQAVRVCPGCGKKYIPITPEEAEEIARRGLPIVARAIATANYMGQHEGARPPGGLHVAIDDDEAKLAGAALRPLLARLALLGPIIQVGGALVALSAVTTATALRAHPIGGCDSCQAKS